MATSSETSSSQSSQMHRVFVYGTLKRGLSNHDCVLKEEKNGVATFISEARLVDSYPLVTAMLGEVLAKELDIQDRIVPFLLPKMPPDRPDNIVVGELYEVDSAMLVALDDLEQHPVWYLRTPTQCIITGTPPEQFCLSSGDKVDCEVYFYNKIDMTPEWYSKPYITDYQES